MLRLCTGTGYAHKSVDGWRTAAESGSLSSPVIRIGEKLPFDWSAFGICNLQCKRYGCVLGHY